MKDIRFTTAFDSDFKALAYSGNYGRIYLDLYRFTPSDADRASHKFLHVVQREYPYLQIGNADALLRELRLIKAALRKSKPCAAPRR